MTRIALIADIHGNLDALSSVLADIERTGADRVVCLGDIIGYGPEPGACIEMIMEHTHEAVLGNHDQAALSYAADDQFTLRALASLERTRDLLMPYHLDALASLPEFAEVAGVSLAHASFTPGRFEYLYDEAAAARSFGGFATRIGAVGHTHIPSMFVELGDRTVGAVGDSAMARNFARCAQHDANATSIRVLQLEEPYAVGIPRAGRVILNPGSVGQPRDRNPLASWGLLDLEAESFSVKRVAYDIDEVNCKILALGMPEFLGQRLRVGA